jgi:hypothetical protein
MKAITLTFDQRRSILEHMLKTYAVHWPGNPFSFLIPYQENTQVDAHGQEIEFVRSEPGIKETVSALLGGLPDEEWIYWCIDDKFLVDLDADAAAYFAGWIEKQTSPAFAGLCFCRARRLLSPDTVCMVAGAQTDRGDNLLLRYNYSQFWLHQFLRVRVVRDLFTSFPDREFVAKEMDGFISTEKPGEGTNLFVTEKNFAVFGESTLAGRLTTGCIANMRKLSFDVPEEFEIVEREILIPKGGMR